MMYRWTVGVTIRRKEKNICHGWGYSFELFEIMSNGRVLKSVALFESME